MSIESNKFRVMLALMCTQTFGAEHRAYIELFYQVCVTLCLEQSYGDPVLGASPSFIQRLLELSTLQEKTVRQEKIKELKKNRRHEP